MCVYKNHAFICFGRPPSWSGTIIVEEKEDFEKTDSGASPTNKQKPEGDSVLSTLYSF